MFIENPNISGEFLPISMNFKKFEKTIVLRNGYKESIYLFVYNCFIFISYFFKFLKFH